jgi:hypothetical protein
MPEHRVGTRDTNVGTVRGVGRWTCSYDRLFRPDAYANRRESGLITAAPKWQGSVAHRCDKLRQCRRGPHPAPVKAQPRTRCIVQQTIAAPRDVGATLRLPSDCDARAILRCERWSAMTGSVSDRVHRPAWRTSCDRSGRLSIQRSCTTTRDATAIPPVQPGPCRCRTADGRVGVGASTKSSIA